MGRASGAASRSAPPSPACAQNQRPSGSWCHWPALIQGPGRGTELSREGLSLGSANGSPRSPRNPPLFPFCPARPGVHAHSIVPGQRPAARVVVAPDSQHNSRPRQHPGQPVREAAQAWLGTNVPGRAHRSWRAAAPLPPLTASPLRGAFCPCSARWREGKRRVGGRGTGGAPDHGRHTWRVLHGISSPPKKHPRTSEAPRQGLGTTPHSAPVMGGME